ncbi:DUF5672 family protein [Synechococcus elongatus]|uniref:DUF5672 family protein n=1 Tax=Synechococcus elongatus TaxID=32046 RepID=UPI0012601006|nr:DUF5672 family protein [Synechococcus elongatus]
MNFLPTCAVVIPIYQPQPIAHEIISISNNLSVLKDYDIFLLYPKSLDLQPYQALQEQAEKEFKYLALADENFTGIAAYNCLMTSRKIYESFNQYDYILIAQTDSYTFEDQLGSWLLLDYDYIGAPWFEGFAQPTSNRMINVGNGGFSLRKVEAFQQACQLLEVELSAITPATSHKLNQIFSKTVAEFDWASYLRGGNVSEDLYFSFVVPQIFPDYLLAKPLPEEAAWFSFECNAEYLYYDVTNQSLPFGCHGWNKYSHEFWANHIPYLKLLKERD